MKNKKILLFIGPLTEKHGQGIVTIETLSVLRKEFNFLIINTDISNTSKIKKIVLGIKNLIEIFIKVIFLSFKKADKFIYFTPSRNILSSFKDFILLLILNLFNIRKKKIKVIAHLHGADLSKLLSQNIYGKILKKLYLKSISTMIINSHSHKIYALGLDYKSYQIINNPVYFDKPTLKKIKNKHIQDYNNLKICFISVPSKTKGLYESIKLLDKSFKTYNWKLHIIGWSKKDYKKIYKNEKPFNKNLSQKIFFLGRVSEKEKLRILLNSNIFILLSHTEAQPLSVIEAAIFKCVIILSNIEMLLEFEKYKTVVINHNDKSSYPFLRVYNHNSSELTGMAFSPDNKRMYFSSQRGSNGNGITYEVNGDFSQI